MAKSKALTRLAVNGLNNVTWQ